MRSASATFRRTMAQRRNFVNYADMTLSDGTVLHLAPEDFRIGGNTIQDDIVDGDAFNVGTAIGKTVHITLDNTSEFFSLFNFYGAVFVLYIGLELDTEPATVEKIRIGQFTVITPATTGMVITMEAVDNMYKFDRSYSESTLVYPATLQQIVADACTHCGVTNNTGQFDRYAMEVTERPSDDVTFRQVISYVAQIACVNAKISDMGALIFTWYTDTVPEEYADGGNFRRVYKPDGSYLTGADLDGGSFNPWTVGDVFEGGLFTDPYSFHDLGFAKSVQVSTDDIVITGVKVKNGEEEYLQGTEDYCIVIQDNPLTVGFEMVVAQAVYAKLFYLTFRPFSLSYLQDPTIESGDWVVVTTSLGDTYFTFCTSVSFTTGGFTNISCKAQSPAQQLSVYQSEAAKAIVTAKREAENKITDYDQAVQRMNALASNAMGMYTMEVGDPIDGSSIYYMSNKPITTEDGVAIFTQGSKVWKLTGDGFFICQSAQRTDAQCTWTSGWDSEGNVVVNTLSTIGLNAEWINTGTLKVGGTAGNVNGKIEVYDASNNLLGRWSKDGIIINGGIIRTTSIHYIGGTQVQYGTEISDGVIKYIPPDGSSAYARILMESATSSSYTGYNQANLEIETNGSIRLYVDRGMSYNPELKLGVTEYVGGGTYTYVDIYSDDIDLNGHHITGIGGRETTISGSSMLTLSSSDDIKLICDEMTINGATCKSSGSVVRDWTTLEKVTRNLSIDFNSQSASWDWVTFDYPSSFYSVRHGLILE